MNRYGIRDFKSNIVLFDPIQHEQHYQLFIKTVSIMEDEVLESWLREFRNWSTAMEGTPQLRRRNHLIELVTNKLPDKK